MTSRRLRRAWGEDAMSDLAIFRRPERWPARRALAIVLALSLFLWWLLATLARWALA